MNIFLFLGLVLVCLSPGTDFKTKTKKVSSSQGGPMIGKHHTTIEHFPYQAGVEYKGKFRCGAAVIGNEWVVTATHCANHTIDPRYLRIRAGTSTRGSGGSVHEVSQLFRHPRYHYVTTDNDIAVIKVSPPFEFSERIQPVQLRKKEPKAGVRGIVTGWGSSVSGGPLESQLHFVSVPIVDRNECNDNYAKYGGITENMICAFQEGHDACKGDSGSPLVIKGKLAGIVSWGMGCNVRERPGVYTNIATLRQFIISKTGMK